MRYFGSNKFLGKLTNDKVVFDVSDILLTFLIKFMPQVGINNNPSGKQIGSCCPQPSFEEDSCCHNEPKSSTRLTRLPLCFLLF